MDSSAPWLSREFASINPAIFLLLGLALLISSIGFYRTVYFISIGYAFAIVGMSIATVIVLRDNLNWVAIVQNIFLFLWGMRLGLYIIQREAKPVYKKERESNDQRSKGVNRKVQVAIWISVSLLYVAMFSPSLFRLQVAAVDPTPFASIIQIVGLVVMGGGFVLESVADKQKSDFKNQNPKKFCNIGLYRIVRCPNYLGEILFWIGSWVIAIGVYSSLLQWAISTIGMLCIVLIMIGSTKRLERSQAERYGTTPEYQEYIRTIPVLIPFVPVYTLKNVRVYLE